MEQLPRKEAQDLLAKSSTGAIALAKEGRAYAFPLFFAWAGDRAVFQVHHGMKDIFLDSTRDACLLVTEIENEDQWRSVQVFGHLSRIVDEEGIAAARDLLQRLPPPPAEGHFPGGRPLRTEDDVHYLQILARRIDGKQSAFADKTADA